MKIPSLITVLKNSKNRLKEDKTRSDIFEELEKSSSSKVPSSDELYSKMRRKALELTKSEPAVIGLLRRSILHPKTRNLNQAISRAISTRLYSSCGINPVICSDKLSELIEDAMNSDLLELGCTMSDAVRDDIAACVRRDPACETELEVVLFFKGFASLVCHRAARRYYCNPDKEKNQRFVSLWLQSQASAAFGVDIHPAAEIGSAVMFDHATGLVIGETAKIGHNCTILHGVTLGGTGKDTGDRHPKVGNDVLIGAGSKILGNIKIGDGVKIGAGSVVLKPIPHGCTAVGAPAKVIGWANERKPGSTLDSSLKDIVPLVDDGEESITASVAVTAPLTISSVSNTPFDSLNDVRDAAQDNNSEQSSDESSELSIDHDEDGNLTFSRNMCIFPAFRCKKLPKGAANYKTLSHHLGKECTEDEIGEIYMDLMKNNPKKKFIPASEISKNLSSRLELYTKLSKGASQMLATKVLNSRSAVCKNKSTMILSN